MAATLRACRRDGGSNRHSRQPQSGAKSPGRPAYRSLCSRRRPRRRRMGAADCRNRARHAVDLDPFRRHRALERAGRNRVLCLLRHAARRNLRERHPRSLGRGEREPLGSRRDPRRGRQPYPRQSGRHGAPAFAGTQHRQSKRRQKHRPSPLERCARSRRHPLIPRPLKSVEQPCFPSDALRLGARNGNYPLLFLGRVHGFLRLQARAARIVWKGFAPLSFAVSTVVRTSASACAAHMAR
jgi:hypothetical protein